MSKCLFLLFSLCFGTEGKIPLPDDLSSLTDICFVQDRIFVLDRRGSQIFSLTPEGKLLGTYSEQGAGPGGFVTPNALTVADGKVYICDMRKQAVIVLSHDLRFLKEAKFDFLVRDIEIAGERIFLLGYHPGTNTMIGRFDLDFNLINRFGRPLDGGYDVFGMQSGRMVLNQGKLYHLPTFRFEIEVFDLEGKLQRLIKAKGFDDDFVAPYRHKSNYWNHMRYRLGKFFLNENQLVMTLHDNEEETSSRYIFDLKQGEWLPVQRPSYSANTLYKGKFYVWMELGERNWLVETD